MFNLKPLNIVVASDNHYIILLAALIKSIEANIITDQKINIYIIEDNISEASKKKLHQSVNQKIISLIWKRVNEVVPEGTKLQLGRDSHPLNIYTRLFIPYFMPEEVEKVLYLDVDMIVQKDISILFENDLSNYALAAVLDPRIITFDNSWSGVLNCKELELTGATRYFNTGLLLMNPRKWRDQNVTEKIIDCINNNKRFANCPDQYGLNVVLANQWLELDPLWNHFCTIEHPAPYLIHFIQRKPIYKSYDNSHEFRRVFYYYLDQTKWKNFRPIDESKHYIRKVKNILNKFF